MTTWTFIWLMVILKIPILALFLIVRWAVRQTPEAEPGPDGGIGPRTLPLHPHRARGTDPGRRAHRGGAPTETRRPPRPGACACSPRPSASRIAEPSTPTSHTRIAGASRHLTAADSRPRAGVRSRLLIIVCSAPRKPRIGETHEQRAFDDRGHHHRGQRRGDRQRRGAHAADAHGDRQPHRPQLRAADRRRHRARDATCARSRSTRTNSG